MNKVISAVAFAESKRRIQRRNDHELSPHINHPIALAHLLANEVGIDDERVIIAALLHDTIEYTQTNEQELSREFGKEIADIVLEVTDQKLQNQEVRTRLQAEHAAGISRRAKLVKLADMICNLRDLATSAPTGWTVERKRDYCEWAKAVVDELRGAHPGLEHLFDKAFQQAKSE